MQTAIAQMIALVIYGNAFLQGRSGTDAFYPANSTFQFCKEVKFVDLEVHGDHFHELPFATDPQQFFARLKQDGCKHLRLAYGPYGDMEDDTPPWMLAGFVGGGTRWLLEAHMPGGTDYWEGRWETSEAAEGSDAIWHVAYGRIAKHHDSVPPPANKILETKADLQVNLPLMIEFARKHDLAEFAASFETALALLEKENPLQEVYHADLGPPNFLPKGSQRLLACAQAAWVFGGMGSWSDLGFEGADQNEYMNLSDGLYGMLLDAVSEGTNASA